MAEQAVPQETMRALRDAIARLEKDRPTGLGAGETSGERAGFGMASHEASARDEVLPFGVPALDRVLSGGLPLRGMTEIRVGETRDAGAATGFTLALSVLCQARRKTRGDAAPILWIFEAMAGREGGAPYGVGLEAHGIDLHHTLFSSPRSLQDALWIAEAALGFSIFAAVILEVRGNPGRFGFQESRRLQLRAAGSGVPVFLMRQAGTEEASGARLRLRVESAPAAAFLLPDGSLLSGGIGNPVFRVVTEKVRAFSPVDAFLEWSTHERRFYSVQPVAVAVPANAAHPPSLLPASAGRSHGADAMGRILAFKRAS